MITPNKTTDSARVYRVPGGRKTETKVPSERRRGLQEGRIYLIWWMVILAIICIGYATTFWI
ncbi:hypothetical protein ECB98_18030 [Brucellaceae bacterium VT-16-1752]|uniref:Uncharacterized protein n=1 Tax=Ochrobactrum soli TaxID=2448455 RepID=A0A849KHK4_9HYPH|nr:hypothetical protein [[Ochrobactrum] soli]NNU61175.1 hypothetical protein [[Ochrobactrum] soli]RRD23011.1 hypothetical protein ECB98_18030 [Brucellaceae bacterium VT-16-1752]